MGLLARSIWAAIAILAFLLPVATSTSALEIVLEDVAADRVERQRRFLRSEGPAPGTPDVARLDERLAERGLSRGRAIYIRVFKAESELELWMQNASGTFTLLDTYPICHWTGTLGPKLKEGDKQSPEGFYSVGVPQTRLVGRWRKAFNLGFPNLHDQRLSRTGSYILVHGGCSSVGCFAMTDPVQNEIYNLATAALSAGQPRFHVHVFPFRMTAENLARHADHEWAHTWFDLKPAYESFERTRIPPVVALCGVRYKVADGLPGETGGTERRLTLLKGAAEEPGQGLLDANGNWRPPQCELEDEARRQPAVAISAVQEGSAKPVEPSISVAPTEVAPAGSPRSHVEVTAALPEGKSDPQPEARPEPLAETAKARTPALSAPRSELKSRPQTAPRPAPIRAAAAPSERTEAAPRRRVPRRNEAPKQARRDGERPGDEAFGSARFGRSERVMARGG